MKKFVKNAISWIIYIAILVGLVVGVPKGLAYILKTDYPMASITSGSMWPALKKGDLVVIKGVDSKEDIAVGDIVVYTNPKGFTIHRVTELREETLVTKGDANNVSDSPVKYEKLIGKALTYKGDKIIKIPYLGHISLLINKPKTNAK
jgi:signal peptidase